MLLLFQNFKLQIVLILFLPSTKHSYLLTTKITPDIDNCL